jgi:hypothetical protein
LIEPPRPTLIRWPIFTVSLDPNNFEAVETSSDTFDHNRAINVPHDVPIRLKLPFAAAMNRKDEAARLTAHDPLNRVK